ncbi:MAG: terpene cyclase/mutase family protein [Candidatus Riflebacteria bacterium]|nr:terpene cyclase/mutase family protein [Candidatus Riflebacteria bacterium]
MLPYPSMLGQRHLTGWLLLALAATCTAAPPVSTSAVEQILATAPAPLAATAVRAEKWLAGAANPDGGFAYGPGRASFTAPTALAVLALGPGPVRSRALDWLKRQQLSDGSWPVCAGDPDGSWMTSTAVAALAGFAEDSHAAGAGRRWLAERCQAYRAPGQAAAGWPWTPGTAPWVEPTAWALIALRGVDAEPGASRVQDAAQYLASQMNRVGGFSLYEARPFPYHTSLVLLAFDSLSAAQAGAGKLTQARIRSVSFLRATLDEKSPVLDLAWGLWALSTGLPNLQELAICSRWLAARQEPTGAFGQASPWVTAVAVCALRALHGRNPLDCGQQPGGSRDQ